MTAGERAALEDRVCLAYEKIRTPQAAHERSRPGAVPYRCPFGKHWHVEAIDLGTLTDVAVMLREHSLAH